MPQTSSRRVILAAVLMAAVAPRPAAAEDTAVRTFLRRTIGLTDAQFNSETAPGQWTYRVIAKHVLTLEQHSLKTIAEDQAARAAGSVGSS